MQLDLHSRNRVLVWLLALLPGLLALLFLNPGGAASPGAWLTLCGRLAGVWGLALLLVSAMLCCRVPGFDRPFGGLPKLWKLHHQLGVLGFLLILAHPVLLALAAVEVSLDAALGTLFTPTAALLSAWLALLLLQLVMAATFAFFGRPSYQHWKNLHRLSGVMLLLALVHGFLLNRSLPGLWGQAIWGLLALLALAAVGWRCFFSRWQGRRQYRISKVEHPAKGVVELSLEPLKRLLKYEAGQFVYLSPHDKALTAGVGEEHPYTLSSSPDEPELRVVIKSLGDASRALQTVRPETLVSIEGPYGAFFPRPDGACEPELWIAGGIGITPFLARLRHATRRGQDLRIHLIHCVQDESRELYREEFSGLMAALPQGQVHIHHFYREGPLTLDYLAAHCPDYASRRVYVCGPDPLLKLARKLLRQGGLPARRILTEDFTLL